MTHQAFTQIADGLQEALDVVRVNPPFPETNDPASAPTLPGRGSKKSLGGPMNEKTNIIVAVPAATPEIEALYAAFVERHNLPYPAESTEEEDDAQHALFVAAQSKLLAATPITARDLALQYQADTFYGGSDTSDEFEAIIAALMKQEPAIEEPALKVRRLSRELSTALAEDADGGVTVALIYPKGAHEFPICFAMDDEYAALTAAAFAYRDAWQAVLKSADLEEHDVLRAKFEAAKSHFHATVDAGASQ